MGDTIDRGVTIAAIPRGGTVRTLKRLYPQAPGAVVDYRIFPILTSD